MKRELIKVDKNGTKHFATFCKCDRCGGTGVYTWGGTINGRPMYAGTCFKCGGAQYLPTVEKEYTPEYRAKLDAANEKRKAKLRAKAEERRAAQEAEWERTRAEREAEAARRGLSNLPSTAECLPALIQEKNIDLVVRHGIYTEPEFRARYAIHLESYNKIVNIEARTMVDMAMHQILPAALRYTKELCDGMSVKQSLGIPCHAETTLVRQLSQNTESLYDAIDTLRHTLDAVPREAEAAAAYYHDTIVPGMSAIRSAADNLEALTDKSHWPYPTYSDLLFY